MFEAFDRTKFAATPAFPGDAGGPFVEAIGRIDREAELAITKDELARQVDSLARLHELAMRLGGISEMQPALQAILDTAVEAQ
ncbi:MAG TPA: hypothetical protein VII36_02835, partial [Usitatibacter sp.]